MRCADLKEKPKVLHVPCAYLYYIGILCNHLKVPWIHDLGDNRKPCLLPCCRTMLQPLLAKALEGIWICPRLICPSPEKRSTCCLDLFCNAGQHGPVLNGTWPCHNRDLPAANDNAADINLCSLFSELTAGKFIGLYYSANFFAPGCAPYR